MWNNRKVPGDLPIRGFPPPLQKPGSFGPVRGNSPLVNDNRLQPRLPISLPSSIWESTDAIASLVSPSPAQSLLGGTWSQLPSSSPQLPNKTWPPPTQNMLGTNKSWMPSQSGVRFPSQQDHGKLWPQQSNQPLPNKPWDPMQGHSLPLPQSNRQWDDSRNQMHANPSGMQSAKDSIPGAVQRENFWKSKREKSLDFRPLPSQPLNKSSAGQPGASPLASEVRSPRLTSPVPSGSWSSPHVTSPDTGSVWSPPSIVSPGSGGSRNFPSDSSGSMQRGMQQQQPSQAPTSISAGIMQATSEVTPPPVGRSNSWSSSGTTTGVPRGNNGNAWQSPGPVSTPRSCAWSSDGAPVSVSNSRGWSSPGLVSTGGNNSWSSGASIPSKSGSWSSSGMPSSVGGSNTWSSPGMHSSASNKNNWPSGVPSSVMDTFSNNSSSTGWSSSQMPSPGVGSRSTWASSTAFSTGANKSTWMFSTMPPPASSSGSTWSSAGNSSDLSKTSLPGDTSVIDLPGIDSCPLGVPPSASVADVNMPLPFHGDSSVESLVVDAAVSSLMDTDLRVGNSWPVGVGPAAEGAKPGTPAMPTNSWPASGQATTMSSSNLAPKPVVSESSWSYSQTELTSETWSSKMTETQANSTTQLSGLTSAAPGSSWSSSDLTGAISTPVTSQLSLHQSVPVDNSWPSVQTPSGSISWHADEKKPDTVESQWPLGVGSVTGVPNGQQMAEGMATLSNSMSPVSSLISEVTEASKESRSTLMWSPTSSPVVNVGSDISQLPPVHGPCTKTDWPVSQATSLHGTVFDSSRNSSEPLIGTCATTDSVPCVQSVETERKSQSSASFSTVDGHGGPIGQLTDYKEPAVVESSASWGTGEVTGCVSSDNILPIQDTSTSGDMTSASSTALLSASSENDQNKSVSDTSSSSQNALPFDISSVLNDSKVLNDILSAAKAMKFGESSTTLDKTSADSESALNSDEPKIPGLGDDETDQTKQASSILFPPPPAPPSIKQWSFEVKPETHEANLGRQATGDSHEAKENCPNTKSCTQKLSFTFHRTAKDVMPAIPPISHLEDSLQMFVKNEVSAENSSALTGSQASQEQKPEKRTAPPGEPENSSKIPRLDGFADKSSSHENILPTVKKDEVGESTESSEIQAKTEHLDQKPPENAFSLSSGSAKDSVNESAEASAPPASSGSTGDSVACSGSEKPDPSLSESELKAALFTSLLQCNIKNDTDASLVLEVISALTEAYLKYKLHFMPKAKFESLLKSVQLGKEKETNFILRFLQCNSEKSAEDISSQADMAEGLDAPAPPPPPPPPENSPPPLPAEDAEGSVSNPPTLPENSGNMDSMAAASADSIPQQIYMTAPMFPAHVMNMPMPYWMAPAVPVGLPAPSQAPVPAVQQPLPPQPMPTLTAVSQPVVPNQSPTSVPSGQPVPVTPHSVPMVPQPSPLPLPVSQVPLPPPLPAPSQVPVNNPPVPPLPPQQITDK